jgi:hypothetical protein
MTTRNDSRRQLFVGVALVAVLALSGCTPTSLAAPALAQTTATVQAQVPTGSSPLRTITVVGRGEVKSKPTVAHTNLGIEVTAATVSEAMTEGQARMADILDAVQGQGIATSDIQTSNFSINYERPSPDIPAPPRPSTDGSQAAAGVYRVSNMVQVTIRDLGKVSAVLDAAVVAGANSIWGVSFGLENTAALEAQAREQAVADAEARAEVLAKLNDVTVGEVISISELVGSAGVPIFNEAAALRSFASGGTPVEPGEVSFSTQIQIIYALR